MCTEKVWTPPALSGVQPNDARGGVAGERLKNSRTQEFKNSVFGMRNADRPKDTN